MPRRALVHPRLFTRGVGGLLTRRVTVEEYVVTGRSPTNAEVRSWRPLRGHENLPAAISALNAQQASAYSADSRIMLPGYHPEVTTKHRVRVVDEGKLYDITKVDQLWGMATRLVVNDVTPGSA